MNEMTLTPTLQDDTLEVSIKSHITSVIDDQINNLPNIGNLTSEEIRGIIALLRRPFRQSWTRWLFIPN